MPVMDGFTFCIQCKNDPQLKNIPFIFYTATYTDPKDEKFALSLGADLFVLKPIEPIEMLDKVQALLLQHAKKSIQEAPALVQHQPSFLKEYNEVLIHKLEDKMAELDEANRVLQESESRFRRLAENAPALIYRLSLPKNQVTYINPAVNELTGYSPEEFYGNPSLTFDSLICPAWRSRFENQIKRYLAGEKQPAYEYQVQHKSGALKWLQQRIVIIEDENGEAHNSGRDRDRPHGKLAGETGH